MQEEGGTEVKAGGRGNGKVFVISLHRTMTRSTDALLSMAGLETVHWPKSFQGCDLQEAVRGREEDLDAVYEVLSPVLCHYEAFGDVPFPTLFRQMARDYPEARFVLVHREPHAWARSVRGMIGGRELKPFEKVQYWSYLSRPVKNLRTVTDEDLLGVYFSHLFAVHDFFESRGELGRLCFVSIDDPEAGEKITRFLGLEQRPFPRIVGGQTDWQTLQEWLRAAPHKPDPHRVLTQVLEQRGSLNEAVDAARELVLRDPSDPNPYRLLTRLLEKAGRRREALSAAEKAVGAGTRSPSLHGKAGMRALGRGRFCRATRLLIKMAWLKGERFKDKRGGLVPFG